MPSCTLKAPGKLFSDGSSSGRSHWCWFLPDLVAPSYGVRCRGIGRSHQHLCETGKETYESQLGKEGDMRVEWINASSLPMMPADTLLSSVPLRFVCWGLYTSAECHRCNT